MTFINGESLSSVRAKINDTIVAVAGMLGFSKVVVAGQADIIAPDKNSTLTLVAGTNVTLTTDGGANSVTISSSSSGAGTTNLAYDAATSVVSSDTGTDATLTLVDGTNPGLMSSASFTKLAGVATGATVNSTDASLRDRSTHTGTQLASTISDFSTAVAATAAVTANTAKVTNATHTGEVTGDTALTITAGAVTLAKQANVATGTVFYRKTAATGSPEVQTLATLKTDLGLTGTNSGDQSAIVGITGTKAQFDTAVTDGNVQWVGDAPTAHTHLLAAGATDVTITAANLNALDDGVNTALHFHDADRARAVHTGTQLAATISDFSTAVAATASVTANTAKVTNATHTGDVTGATALTIDPTAISGKTLVTAVGADHLLILDATDGTLKKALASDLISGGGATNLSYTAATRVIASDTGTDATLPLMSSGDAGLVPASGGGTTNFLRADGTFAVPSGGGGSFNPVLSWAY